MHTILIQIPAVYWLKPGKTEQTQNYEWRYLGNTTATKHRPPDASEKKKKKKKKKKKRRDEEQIMTSQTPHTMIKLLSNDDKIAFMSLYNVLCHVCICLPLILIGYTCSCAVNKILFYSILFYSVKSPTHEKINCNRGTTLDQSIVKLLGFKPVLLAQNLTLNSGTALLNRISHGTDSSHVWKIRSDLSRGVKNSTEFFTAAERIPHPSVTNSFGISFIYSTQTYLSPFKKPLKKVPFFHARISHKRVCHSLWYTTYD